MGQVHSMRLSLRHFTSVFSVRNKQGTPLVLIGGQAVNYWAELYSTKEPGLAKWQPFTSEDIDFQGTREDVGLIASQLGLVPVFPRSVEMTALAGMIPFKHGDLKSQIEVVSSVPGVPAKLLQQTALEATWEKHQIRVIDPISLLYAKAHLALKVSQKGRRDTDHLAIMVLCVRAFLGETLHKVEDGSLPARNWLAAMERVLALSESTTGAKTARRFGTDWTEALPLKEIERCAVSQIVVFRHKRLPRWKAKIASFVRDVPPSEPS
ncbi:MAG: hypothetical protein JWQ71_3217 [Pedosphaera sp.]|nr:hypothetical protein [Pedosphaera sp.]